ncbi:Avirulence (Avh) protein [Phytophthora cinnamomi]|uniref:Avirulence (Avh) protein n=1 Tax=Phytophthora cinnamomi TaxID=4785 RepID=UPI0035596985|nr:Avirulence (Avh) protein [Phytophthora cinnamomi]
MATRARKRQRAQHQHRQLALEEHEEDHLLHMDPSLMTERQQLAFLLRTTAHEASDASHPSEDSSEDEVVASPRRLKKPRRIQRVSSVEEAAAAPTHRGRGRPPKHKKSPRAATGTKLRVSTQHEKSKQPQDKPSPSSSDDLAHLDAARSFAPARPPRCALCCDYDTAYEASFSDALFLCPACDQKYPTQQALSRRACVT